MTQISTSPESLTAGDGASGESAPPVRPQALDAVRRELRRSHRLATRERWTAGRLREQLPRVTLDEALEILLKWRGEARFDAGAVAWHARLAGHAPQLTLDDAERALAALERLGGPSPEVGALTLRALCERYRLDDAASVLGEWLSERQSFGGF
ncbi:MAG TPA: hypothetical protein VJU80_06395 [Solirubrobacteraceae bacterium]|nr:hypothetical protein [Solirubrobacteraceae bacterium]